MMYSLRLVQTLIHGQQKIYLSKKYYNISHVFIWRDFQRFLQPSYEGTFEILKRLEKDFIPLINCQEKI